MRNQKVFLNSLNSFLHSEADFHGTRKLEAEDWEEILKYASKHAVLPIVYDAAWQKTSFKKVPEQVRMEYKTRIMGRIVFQTRATDLFLDVYKRMTKLGITPLVMKGIICRDMYEYPDYRVSNDEDILIERKNFPKLDQILQQCGFRREFVEDYRKEHEITYHHQGNKLHLEVHLSLFPEESGSYGRLNKEFPHVFERQIIHEINGVQIHTLDVTQHMLYLLCHGLKHFLHSGFGIRQLCDMILFAETYGKQINWNEIIKRTKRQNMYIFWMNLFDIGERYLGFSWKKAGLARPDREILDSELMLEDILDSGIFGKSSKERVHSANITLQASDGTGKKNTGMMASLFPDVGYMRRQYPYLVNHKWLLPAAWIQRMISYKKSMRGRDMTKPIETGKQRVELLRRYGIIEEE